jgi:hypothetical protein
LTAGSGKVWLLEALAGDKDGKKEEARILPLPLGSGWHFKAMEVSLCLGSFSQPPSDRIPYG